MAWARIAIVQEFWQPLAGVTIEAFNLDDPHLVVAVKDTDTAGVAIFNGLPNNQRFFFKPRVTRFSGKYGERTQYGDVKLQILASSGSTCFDAVVDGSGAKRGSHETIQAAIDAFATGDVGTTRPAFIGVLVRDGAADHYTETLTFLSTRRYVLQACMNGTIEAMEPEGSATGVPAYPGVSIRGTNAAAATIGSSGGGTGQLEMRGFQILAPVGATVDYTWKVALMKTRLINCYVTSAFTGAVQPGLSADFEADHCFFGDSQTKIGFSRSLASAVNLFWCQIQGKADLGSQAGCKMSFSVVRASRTDEAVLLANQNAGSSYRVENCYIFQNGTGAGIRITGDVGADAWGHQIVGCMINGAGVATSLTGILFTASCEAGLAVGNTIEGFATGVDAAGAPMIRAIGNTYINVTTHCTGFGGTGSYSDCNVSGAVGGSSSPVVITATPDLDTERVLTGSSTILITDNGPNSTVVISIIPGGIDHGALGGLGDDDHTQYLLLAGRVAAQQDITKGITVSTYARIGSAVAPTNVTAGDLTVGRLFIPDAALDSEARLVQIADSYTPGAGAFNSLYVRTNVTPGAGLAADEVRAAKFEVNIRPTAIHAGQVRAFYAEAEHDSGAFDITGSLTGFFTQAIQNVALTTITDVRAYYGAVRAVAGTITQSYGILLDAGGVGADAGTITNITGIRLQNKVAGIASTTQIGIQVDSLTGATTNIALRVLGSASHARFTGSVVIGADASPPAATVGLYLTQLMAQSGNSIFVGVDGSAPVLVLSAMDGVNEGGEITLNGAAANIDWNWDNNAGNLRWFQSGQVRMQLNAGTPAANQTNLFLQEGIVPTQRRVQWVDPGAAGVNLVAGQLVMVLV